MEDIKYWIWISRINFIGSIKIQKLLKAFKTPENLWNATKEELLKIEGISEKNINTILCQKYKMDLDKYVKYMEKEKIELINLNDNFYPKRLKEIYDKPVVLYVKGDKTILNNFSLAIIGCRENTKYGEYATKKITSEIAKNGIVTISGLAIGIDSIAHKTTLESRGKTIAVIGSGIDNIYPKQNYNLANEIIRNGGAIVSEYVIGTKPQKMNFPARNRIISGISNGVIVIEAKMKSGTMITVDFALEQGKEVFAVPGNITSINSEGTNYLIKQGAKCITNIQDIIEEYK